MKLLQSIKQYFYGKYIALYYLLTVKLISTLSKMLNKDFMAKNNGFQALTASMLYVTGNMVRKNNNLEFLTSNLLTLTNEMVRKLIISKGKDPDYVPPPPAPTPPAPKKLSTNFVFTTVGPKNWVKKPQEHPILKLRNLPLVDKSDTDSPESLVRNLSKIVSTKEPVAPENIVNVVKANEDALDSLLKSKEV